MAKSSGAQRESDGVVLLMIGLRDTSGGKDLDFGHVDRWGRRDSPVQLPHRRQSTGWGDLTLLANIVLHELDRQWDKRTDGVLVRFADDGVVMCRTRHQAEAALVNIETILAGLGPGLHPEKTKVVELREGRKGFDFLDCHFHARLSGPLWERGIRRYYLHRWPSLWSMKRVRSKIKTLAGRRSIHRDVRDVIAELNPILRGWGNHYRTGNAAIEFNQLDKYVVWRLRCLLVKRYGRNLHASRADTWTRAWFETHGLHRLQAASAIQELRNHTEKTIGKPCAGNPHARIERRMGKRARTAESAP